MSKKHGQEEGRALERKDSKKAGQSSRPRERDSLPGVGWSPGLSWLAFAGFSLLGLLIYQPVLSGDFISDDLHYVKNNPYVHAFFHSANFWAIWDPTSVVTFMVENYAPVHLILHGLEWQVFGSNVLGYHVVNVLMHALAATMLIAVYRRSGIASIPAVVGAAAFLVHPANVESVAWISQLKSSSALVLSLAAILAHPKRPVLGVVLFALALFAKPFSAFALFIVACSGWLARRRAKEAGDASSTPDFRWPFVGAWVVVVLAFAVLEIYAFSQSAGLAPALYRDPGVRLMTIFAVALRYLMMAISGLGLSTFHEPAPVESFLDPRLLIALLVLAGLGYRVFLAWREKREELLYWLWAAVSFAPLSGVVPLPYPMADRYLYFVLPGLIGALLSIRQVAAHRVARAAFSVALPLLVFFCLVSHDRAPVYASGEALMADAERNYPDGTAASIRKARRAAGLGDFASAVAYLEMALARGYNQLDHLVRDPRYGPMQSYPPFVALKARMAQGWIERLGKKSRPSQLELQAMAQAHVVLGDYERALAAIRQGMGIPGPITEDLREREARLLARLAAEKRKKGAARH